MDERAVTRLAMLLHNEFCKKEECDGVNDFIESARRLLPKIQEHVVPIRT